MSGWGISPNAPEKEKIKSELADYLNGLNSTCEITYNVYSELFDFGMKLLESMYDLGAKSDPATNWTPCAEGLPANSGVYGVTWKNLETDRDFASFGTFDAHMQRWDDQNERYVITAWMPKPAPYRAYDTTGKVKEDAECKE